jgi:hypothetical protein
MSRRALNDGQKFRRRILAGSDPIVGTTDGQDHSALNIEPALSADPGRPMPQPDFPDMYNSATPGARVPRIDSSDPSSRNVWQPGWGEGRGSRMSPAWPPGKQDMEGTS